MALPDLLEMDLVAGAEDWSPTPHGIFMAEVLAGDNVVRGKEVLELGGGLGNHTIILVRQGAKRVVTTEIGASRAETTRRNVEANCPGATNVEYRVADSGPRWRALLPGGDFSPHIGGDTVGPSGSERQRSGIPL